LSSLLLACTVFYKSEVIDLCIFDVDIVVMPFLSHSLPWQSLSRLFEYRGPKSGPGPQEPHLYTEEAPAHRKQLEHFAIHFQETVREHSLTERAKYSTVQAYCDRAATWTASSSEEPPVQGHGAQSSNVSQERHGQRSSIKISADTRTIALSKESRRVYPAYFSKIYMSLVPPESGGFYGREGLLENLADISTWINHCTRYDQDWASGDEKTRNLLWLDEKSCSDVLRLLVIDAATTSDGSQQKESISPLLLLANHPEVRLEGFFGDGMVCCGLSTGLSALVEKTVMVFIFFNLLLALIDDKHGRLLRLCDTLEQFKPARGRFSLVELLPRPAYMNMRRFVWMRDYVLDEHGHAVEHVLFNPLLAPRPSGRRSCRLKLLGEPEQSYYPSYNEDKFERDVMANRESLHEALKQMWKVLIFCDMIFREAGKRINWEYVSLNAIYELFLGSANKLVGHGYWIDYEDERTEAGSFSFYADSGNA
jgi:hypothetical protein